MSLAMDSYAPCSIGFHPSEAAPAWPHRPLSAAGLELCGKRASGGGG